jgi:carbonic anhydrase
MTFATALCCMDGRIQLPVLEYLKVRFGVKYIDNITYAGPVGLAPTAADSPAVESIFRLIEVSMRVHDSKELAVVAHHDCAGNPVSESVQLKQLQAWIETLEQTFPGIQIIGLWLDKDFQVHEYPSRH